MVSFERDEEEEQNARGRGPRATLRTICGDDEAAVERALFYPEWGFSGNG